MRLFLIAGSIFMLIIGISLFSDGLKELEAYREGEFVPVVLLSVPGGRGDADISYDGGTYKKSVGRRFYEDYKVGDTLHLRHIEGTENFYFQGETGIFSLVLSIFGILMSITCFVKGVRST